MQTHIIIDEKTKKELQEVAQNLGLSLSAFLRMSAIKESKKINSEVSAN